MIWNRSTLPLATWSRNVMQGLVGEPFSYVRLVPHSAGRREHSSVPTLTAQEQQLPFFLGNWRRALIRRRLYAGAWRWLVVALCVALVGVALYRVAAGAVPLWPIIILPLAVWSGGLALVARRPLTLMDTARLLDRRLQLDEQLATGLERAMAAEPSGPLSPYLLPRAATLAALTWRNWSPTMIFRGERRTIMALCAAVLAISIVPALPRTGTPARVASIAAGAGTAPVAQVPPIATGPDRAPFHVQFHTEVVSQQASDALGATKAATGHGLSGRQASLTRSAQIAQGDKGAAPSTKDAKGAGRSTSLAANPASGPRSSRSSAVDLLHNHMMPSGLQTGSSTAQGSSNSAYHGIPLIPAGPLQSGAGPLSRGSSTAANKPATTGKPKSGQTAPGRGSSKTGSNPNGGQSAQPSSRSDAKSSGAGANKPGAKGQTCLYVCSNIDLAHLNQKVGLQTGTGRGISSRSLTGAEAGSDAGSQAKSGRRSSSIPTKDRSLSLNSSYGGTMSIVPLRAGATAPRSGNGGAARTGADVGNPRSPQYLTPDSNAVSGLDRSLVSGYFTPSASR